MDTVIMVMAVIFAVVMLFMLPRYARFINEQPKKHLEQMRQREEQEKKKAEENNSA